jgi:MSHA biogenesis protein MshI
MAFWNRKSGAFAGWNAVDTGPHGVCSASVLSFSKARDNRPQVMQWDFSSTVGEFDQLKLGLIAKDFSTPDFGWTLPLSRGDYKLLVLPQPPVPESEMEESLRWSLGTMLDFPISEATIDWLPIPTREQMPQRPLHVYAVAARQEVIRSRSAPFVSAKLPLHAVDIRETAQRNIAAQIEKPGEGLGLISMNNEGLLLTFTCGRELYLDRFIEEPIEAMLAGDAESRRKILDRIVLQVQRSQDFIGRTLPFVNITRIVVAPLPAPIPLAEHLAQNLSVPVETLDLASVFDFSLTPDLGEQENQARAFIALGAALRGREAEA